MRLVGVALLDRDLRREGGRRHVGLGLGERREAREALVQLLLGGQMVEVAHEERAPARPRPAALAEGDDRRAREAPQVLLRAQHRAPQRVLAEGGAVDQVLGDRRGLVVGAVDLLDHHPALAVELLGVDLRAAHEVAQQVDRRCGGLRAHRDVEGDEIVAGVGVQHAAEALRGLVDVGVRRVLLPALEHEVLEEVRHPVLLRALGARPRVERHQRGERARARDRHAVHRQAVGGDGGGGDARHRPTLLVVPSAPVDRLRRHLSGEIANCLAGPTGAAVCATS